MDVYGSQTGDDVADRGLCNTTIHTFISALERSPSASPGVILNSRPFYTTPLLKAYLDSKVLVSFPQQGVHVLDHQLRRSVQQVKVQEEAQQRWSIHSLQKKNRAEYLEKMSSST